MLCFNTYRDFLSFGTGLDLRRYTGTYTGLIGSGSTQDIPIFGGTSPPTIGMDACHIGSLNQTFWLPTIWVSGTGGSLSTISSRMSASFSSSCGVILGVQAAAPLLTLTVPGTVLKTAFLSKAPCCQLMLAISVEAVAVLGLATSCSLASLSETVLMDCAHTPKLLVLFLSYTK